MTKSLRAALIKLATAKCVEQDFYAVWNFFKLFLSSFRKDSVRKTVSFNVLWYSVNHWSLAFKIIFKISTKKMNVRSQIIADVSVSSCFSDTAVEVTNISGSGTSAQDIQLEHCFVQGWDSVWAALQTPHSCSLYWKLVLKRGHVSLLNITQSHCIWCPGMHVIACSFLMIKAVSHEKILHWS